MTRCWLPEPYGHAYDRPTRVKKIADLADLAGHVFSIFLAARLPTINLGPALRATASLSGLQLQHTCSDSQRQSALRVWAASAADGLV